MTSNTSTEINFPLAANSLKEFRSLMGIDQEEFSENLEIATRTLSKYENGEMKEKKYHLLAAQAFYDNSWEWKRVVLTEKDAHRILNFITYKQYLILVDDGVEFYENWSGNNVVAVKSCAKLQERYFFPEAMCEGEIKGINLNKRLEDINIDESLKDENEVLETFYS